jgi:hypothetical protein
VSATATFLALRCRIVGWLAVLSCAGGSGLGAQVVQLQPHAELSVPTRISLEEGVLHLRQKIGVKLGARLIMSFNPRFDVTTGISYVPGYAMVHGAGKRFELSTSSHVLSGSTTARYWLRRPASALSWEIHSGIGVTLGGGRAFQQLFDSSTLSGVLGTVLCYQLGRIVNLKMKVEERFYRFRFGDQVAGRPSSPFQVSFAIGLPFLESAHAVSN